MAVSIITQEWLKEHFSYEPKTGILRQVKGYRGSGPRRLGSPIGTKDRKGYLRNGFRGHYEFVHRVIWLYAYGRWPLDQLDHINGIKDDNRLDNLREATNSQNKRNSRVRRDNTTGIAGVNIDNRTGRYRTSIVRNGKRQWLGYFATPEEARAVRNDFVKRYYGEFGRES